MIVFPGKLNFRQSLLNITMAPRGIVPYARGMDHDARGNNDSCVEYPTARFDRIQKRIMNASNDLFSLSIGLINQSETLNDSIGSLFGPQALGGLGALPVIAEEVVEELMNMEGFHDELIKVLFSFFSSCNCFLLSGSEEDKVRKWCDNLGAVFETLVPNTSKEKDTIKKPVMKCTPMKPVMKCTPMKPVMKNVSKEKLPPVDLCSGFLTMLFLEVLCAITLDSGEMKLQKPIDRMYASSNVFDQTCLAPNLLTLSEYNLDWIDESFGISDDKEMSSLNCISDDKEMSSLNCISGDKEVMSCMNDFKHYVLRETEIDFSLSLGDFLFALPTDEMVTAIYEFETKRGKCPPVRSYKDKLKKWKFIIQCS